MIFGFEQNEGYRISTGFPIKNNKIRFYLKFIFKTRKQSFKENIVIRETEFQRKLSFKENRVLRKYRLKENRVVTKTEFQGKQILRETEF